MYIASLICKENIYGRATVRERLHKEMEMNSRRCLDFFTTEHLTLQVYGVATEDMDALTFGTPVLLRHMTFSEARKMPIKEFHLPKVLEELELSHEEVRPSYKSVL